MVGEVVGESDRWARPGEEGTYTIPIIAHWYLLVFFTIIKL